GYGWFIDTTPAEHSEFSPASDLTLIALPDSEAASLIDLRTVILHELGHLLGYEHDTNGLMQETLASGVRYLADWESATDEFFGSLADNTELGPF
ncbi:matrixin family metalloprotease, partial [Gimesia sp.]|uniref:matrixin family metalloprotease n=1 Tax=Gimesia sp. TaxID=2024833 RepID=UPI0032EDA1FD